MLKLYMTPGSCTTGIHIILEELDLLFEVHLVNLLNGDHHADGFTRINPKSSIPLLVTESGQAITEFQAIAWWLARQHPAKNLLGNRIEDEVRILETMDYVVSTVHMQGFARIFTSDKFCSIASHKQDIVEQGREIVNQAFSIINEQLTPGGYVVDEFSIADAALFYTEFWASRSDIELPEHCQSHYQSMLQRPAVRQVLMEEGYRVI